VSEPVVEIRGKSTKFDDLRHSLRLAVEAYLSSSNAAAFFGALVLYDHKCEDWILR